MVVHVVHTSRQGDPCITLPGSVYFATSLAMLTSKSKLAFKNCGNYMIRNRCYIFGVDGDIHTKNGGKTYYSPFLELIPLSSQKILLLFKPFRIVRSSGFRQKLMLFQICKIENLTCIFVRDNHFINFYQKKINTRVQF